MISCHQQNTLTYDALDVQSNALARGLANIGVKKGDRVAVSLGNNVEFATVGYAPNFNHSSADRGAGNICTVQTWGNPSKHLLGPFPPDSSFTSPGTEDTKW